MLCPACGSWNRSGVAACVACAAALPAGIPTAEEPPDAHSSALRKALGNRYLMVQRDLKPVNIVFNDDGHAMITALVMATAQFHSRLTVHGRAMATPHENLPRVARAASTARLVPTSTTPV